MTYKYVGPTLLRDKVEKYLSNHNTLFHRVDKIEIQRIAVENPDVLAEFKNLTEVKLTAVYSRNAQQIHQELFPDWNYATRSPQVDEFVLTRK